jgi:hypothetical protein
MPDNASHDEQVRQAIDRVVDVSRKLLDISQRPVRRDQHPKHHGCVRAKFVVAPDLAREYRHGLFAQEKMYDAWIRFSNGRQVDDRKPDAHGMAIKLMGVEGEKALAEEKDATTHDFVMVDNPVFFIRNAIDYGKFSAAVLQAKGKAPSRLYTALGFLGGTLRELATLFLLYFIREPVGSFMRMLRFASKRIANPLTTRYWSTTPYAFGDTSMKFSAVPAEFPAGVSTNGPDDPSDLALVGYLRSATRSSPAPKPAASDSRDYLRETMARSLKAEGALFLFQVQVFKDAHTTPVEDPTIEWPESAASFQTLAWIWIPPQVPDTPARMAFCENLSFTPWHALAVHKPLGEINLVRRAVYRELSDVRHQANGIPRMEPDQSTNPDAGQPPYRGDVPTPFSKVLEDELKLIRERRQELDDKPGGSAGALGLEAGQNAPGDRDQRAGRVDTGAVRGVPANEDRRVTDMRLEALGDHVTGLAFSGGGIRAGTFAVGFLQGLAALGLIRRFDYLSTVSGGGYAGAWLAAWLKREGATRGMSNTSSRRAG